MPAPTPPDPITALRQCVVAMRASGMALGQDAADNAALDLHLAHQAAAAALAAWDAANPPDAPETPSPHGGEGGGEGASPPAPAEIISRRQRTPLELVADDLANTLANPEDVALVGRECFRLASELHVWSPLAPLLARLGETLRARADIDRSEHDA